MATPERPLCFYSTNSWIKWSICNRLRGDTHYVWCSPVFDPSAAARYDPHSLIAPTSSPAEIYRDLSRGVRRGDRHNEKISRQKATLADLIERWRRDGELSDDDADDYLTVMAEAELSIWRPILYVIPSVNLTRGRIQRVPFAKRAAIGDEFIIADLKGSEFDRIEFDVQY